jgi:hypothetical protein
LRVTGPVSKPDNFGTQLPSHNPTSRQQGSAAQNL